MDLCLLVCFVLYFGIILSFCQMEQEVMAHGLS